MPQKRKLEFSGEKLEGTEGRKRESATKNWTTQKTPKRTREKEKGGIASGNVFFFLSLPLSHTHSHIFSGLSPCRFLSFTRVSILYLSMSTSCAHTHLHFPPSLFRQITALPTYFGPAIFISRDPGRPVLHSLDVSRVLWGCTLVHAAVKRGPPGLQQRVRYETRSVACGLNSAKRAFASRPLSYRISAVQGGRESAMLQCGLKGSIGDHEVG